eukprot:g23053.t1
MRLAALLLALTRAFELPRIHPEATSLLSDGKWWAQVGDHVVHTPHASSGLSTNIGNYYYAYGSHKALNDELRDKRVQLNHKDVLSDAKLFPKRGSYGGSQDWVPQFIAVWPSR